MLSKHATANLGIERGFKFLMQIKGGTMKTVRISLCPQKLITEESSWMLTLGLNCFSKKASNLADFSTIKIWAQSDHSYGSKVIAIAFASEQIDSIQTARLIIGLFAKVV